MGFGRTVTATALGQPLNFSARVVLDADETLARECVSAEVFVGEARLPSAGVRVTLEPTGEGNDRNVRVTTSIVIDEPIVTVNVSVGCGSRVSRRFVSFIDPPAVNLAEAGAGALPPQRTDNQIAPLIDITRAADASRRRAASDSEHGVAGEAIERRSARAATTRGQRVASAAGSSRHASATRPRRSRTAHTAIARRSSAATLAAAPSRNVPRLQLEAPALRAAASAPPAVTAATVASTAPVVTAPDPTVAQAVVAQPPADSASEALARERERIQLLETGLARLRADSQAQQQTLVALQARLRQAESDRYANWLVYVLAAGLVFFALLAAAFWALRPRQRRRARWFDAAAAREAQAQREGRSRSANAPVAASGLAPFATQPPVWERDGLNSVLPHTSPATIGGLEVTTVLGPEYSRPLASPPGVPVATASGSGKRGATLSMEELIDLEQQVEFFVVLGQDEAAIELLGAHLRSEGGTSPLPYLKLLEIYQRRGDQPAYERVRDAFRARFHAFAPDWNSDLHFGRSLDEYPQTVARLQALWSTPMHAMQALDGLLFRRNETDDAFDFPAYRELLFLYSIARELAGNVDTDFGSIDLFLPLEDPVPDLRLRSEGSGPVVDLDVSAWSADTKPDELVIRRSGGRS
ncbi:MAG: hypothetical protein ABJA61_06735 [Caldimonas sp.]